MSKTYEEREAQILSISLQLFIKNGIKETTVNEIVKAVNIAKGTFYHYFESKEDLVEMLKVNYMRQFYAMTSDYVALCKTGDWPGKVKAWCMGALRYYFHNHEEYHALFHQQSYLDESKNGRYVLQYLQNLLLEGNEVNAWQVKSPDLVALLIYHGMHITFDECRNGDLEQLENMTERFYEIFMQILMPK